jgi:glycosyltransferase involved in cell wall biosynthesis
MKVLLINPLIPDYRIPIFNLIGSKHDLTVLHSGNIRNEENYFFKQVYFENKKIGPFFWSSINLNRICKKYDIIISEANIRYLDRNLLIINPLRKYKWISWGIGVSASYDKKIGENKIFDFFRFLIFKKTNALIFYSNFPIARYLKAGFNKESIFVANNTTEVNYDVEIDFLKEYILFVGTLYAQKNIYYLLDAYKAYSLISIKPIVLHIIGNGPEKENIEKYIKLNKLENNILLHGAVYDQDILQKYFRSSLACISPGQAGLSVLTSMGYGTPFVTKSDAITGGEIFNIINNENGIIFNKYEDLIDILFDIEQNKEKYIKYGLNARKFYIENRLPEMMANEFINACNFVFKK